MSATKPQPIKKIKPSDPQAKSADLVRENLASLRQVFPEAFTEGKVDFDVLRQLLGDAVDTGEEKYGLNWHGKRQARQLALTPSTGTLRPAPEDSVNWGTTENLMIEGDNLEVLKLLQKSYAGKIKLIYIDPPYNTGKDFVYPDDYRDNIGNYLELTGQKEGDRKITNNPESNGRFHTDWLNMMYPRLKLARELLAVDGLIVIHIDHNELANLRGLCDSIFGASNFLANLVWKTGRTASAHFTTEHEYLLAFAKDKALLPLFTFSGDDTVSDRTIKKPGAKNPESTIDFPPGIAFESEDKVFPSKFGDSEPVQVVKGTLESRDGKLANGVTLKAAWAMKDMIESWLRGEEVYDQKGQKVSRFYFKANGVLQYEKQKGTLHPRTIIDFIPGKRGSSEVAALLDGNAFDFPKPSELPKQFVELLGPNDLVLDFFAGSGTTGHAVMSQNAADGGNRKYILVQLPEPLDPDDKDQKIAAEFCKKLKKPLNIAELTKERLRRAAKLIAKENPDFKSDLGFRVFKLDTSNIKTWDSATKDLEQSLLANVDNIKPDRTEEDLLTELLLKLGLSLTDPVEQRTIGSHTVTNIGAGTLLACLSDRINKGSVEKLASGIADWFDESVSEETTVIFRDSAFTDDVAKSNMAAILHQRGIKAIRSI